MFATFFTPKKRKLIGIDICSSSIKLIELSHQSGATQVESFAVEPLPDGAVIDYVIHDDNAVGEAVSNAVSRIQTSAKKVATAVSGSSVFTKQIEMDTSLSDNELDTQIRVEADQHIPFPSDEVALDWERLDNDAQPATKANILLSACKTEAVEQLVDAIEYAGLETDIVDVGAFCVERTFQYLRLQIPPEKQGLVAVVDIGSALLTLNVLHEGRSIYNRDQHFGGHQLTELIADRFAISEEEAERAKVDNNLGPAYQQQILQPFLQSIALQIGRALQYFYSSSQFEQIDYLLLAGGTACLEGLAAEVHKGIGVETALANPFATMTAVDSVDMLQLQQKAPAMLVACGLAMRGLS